jgi:transketolase N-terminal domain/subunit
MSRTKHDRDLVAAKQQHEVDHVQEVFEGVPEQEIKDIVKEHGHSRKRLYAILEEKGYVRKPKEQTDEQTAEGSEPA